MGRRPASSVSSCLGGSKPLPTGWRWVKLGEVCSRIRNGTTAHQVAGDSGLPVTRIETISSGEIDPARVGRLAAEITEFVDYVLNPGDILFSHINSLERLGACALYRGTPTPLVHGMNLLRLEPNGEVLSEYLLYCLRWEEPISFFRTKARRAIGQASLNTRDISALPIPLPPLSEQRRIAGILREQMAAVERARAAARARLEAVKALPAAYLRQVFPQPAQPLPPGWRWVKLGEVGDVVNGFGFTEVYQGRRDLPYPFVKVSDMNSPGAEVLINEAANTVDEAILAALGARCYPAGTIVFPKVGGALLTNKRRILGREASFDNNIMGVVPRNADGEFVFFWFSSVDLAAHANTQALPSIRQSLVASLEIPLPPLSEQRRIAGILREQMAAVERARAAAEAELEAIEALPAALLRRAFSGEL